MKKYLAIVACAGLLLTVTGCGNDADEKENFNDDTKVKEKFTNKVLSCIESYDDSDMSMTTTFLYDLEGKSFSKATFEIFATIPRDETLSEDDYEEVAAMFCEDYDKEEIYKKCDTKIDGDKFLVTVDIDINKLDEEEQGFTKNTPIEELKEMLSDDDSGITCTIEEK